MSDMPRPPLGPIGARESTARTSGEPNGPRPPVLEVVDRPARDIENRLTSRQSSNVVASAEPPRATGPDVAVRGFHGGVEHSQEMRAARRADDPRQPARTAVDEPGRPATVAPTRRSSTDGRDL